MQRVAPNTTKSPTKYKGIYVFLSATNSPRTYDGLGFPRGAQPLPDKSQRHGPACGPLGKRGACEISSRRTMSSRGAPSGVEYSLNQLGSWRAMKIEYGSPWTKRSSALSA